MSKLDKPRNVKAAILAALMTLKDVSEQDFRYNSFRARISDLREDGLSIQFHDKEIINSFGKKVTRRVHYLLSIDLPQAKELYAKINQYGQVRELCKTDYVTQSMF